jgi:hypothetical protein
MQTVSIDEVDVQVNPLQVHEVRKPVSDALGTEHFAMNYVKLAPGDSVSGDSIPTTTRKRSSPSSQAPQRSRSTGHTPPD